MENQTEVRGTESGSSVFAGQHDRRKVTDWVYQEIREAIIDLRLQPGEPLREGSMAQQLGVSKTPVREALARLEQEGLVETQSFKGAVVGGYAREDLVEIYELRELLEGAAARSAAAASGATLTRLANIVARSRERRSAGDLAGLALLLGEFDSVIYEQVSNTRIRGLIGNLHAHLTRIGRLTEGIPGRVEASVEEHAAIVDAIIAGNGEEAEQRMRLHIRSVLNDQLATMATGIQA